MVVINAKNLNQLAGTIENRRKALLMSQQELAERSGVSQATISFIESGKRIPGLMNFVNIISQLQFVLKLESEK
jgi:transcriptional regulator with XRE-family HTH domain